MNALVAKGIHRERIKRVQQLQAILAKASGTTHVAFLKRELAELQNLMRVRGRV